MPDLAHLGLAIDSSDAVTATANLDKLAVSAGRSERATEILRGAAGGLVAALRENTAATSALTLRMNDMRAASTQAQGAVQSVSTAASTAASNVVQLHTATKGAGGSLESMAGSARNAGLGYRSLADQAVESLRRIEGARRSISALPALDLAPSALRPVSSAVPPLRPLVATVPPAPSAVMPWGAPPRDGPTGPRIPQGAAAASRNGRLDAYQAQNMFFQGSDIAVSLAGGINPLMVAMQQGPQIAQSFVGPGGASLKGAFSQAGEAATGLISRIGLVGGGLGGLTAVVVGGAAAWASYRSEQKDVERQLDGIGRASGVTLSSLNTIAAANAGAGHVSVSEARSFGATFAGTGRIGPDMLGGLIATTRDFAKVTGQDGPEAANALAAAFADPSRGADDLNKRLGFLNDTTRETVRRLDAQGDRLGAQRVMLDAYRASLKGATEATSGWGRMTEDVGNTISNLWTRFGQNLDKGFGGGSLEQRLAAEVSRIRELEKLDPSGALSGMDAVESFGGGRDNELRTARRSARDIQARIKERDDRNEVVQRNQRSIEIGVTIRSLTPELTEFRDMEDAAIKLRKAVTEPVKWGLDGRQLAEAGTAFARISENVRQAREDIERFGSVAAAQANRAADNRRALVGMPEFERNREQIQQQFRDRMREQQLPLDTPSAPEVAADNARRMRETPGWGDKINLEKAQEERLRTARLADAYRRERDVDLETVSDTSAYEASRRLRTANDNLSAVQMSPYQRQRAELEARQREQAERDRGSAAAPINAKTFAAERAALDFEAYNRPIREATDALNDQIGALRLQRDAFELSTGQAAKMAAQQQLSNQYARQGITDLSGMKDAIEAYGDAAAKAAEQNEELSRKQRQVVGGMDDLRGGTRGIGTGIVNDMMRGKDPSKNVLSGVQNMTSQFVDRQVMAPMVAGLLGPEGKAGGGLVGDFFGGLFGKAAGLDKTAITASTVTIQASAVSFGQGGVPGLSSLIGGADKGAAGIPGASSLVSSLAGKAFGGSTDTADSIIAGLSGQRREVAEYFKQGAIARNMDPGPMLRTIRQESNFNRYAENISSKETSYGVAQLNTMGGLGVEALRRGIDPRDPTQWRRQADFAMDTVKVDGYRKWYGARDVGIGRWDGVNPGAGGRGLDTAPKIPTPSIDVKSLDTSLKSVSDAAARASEGTKQFGSDLIQLPTPLAQTSQGLDQLGNSVGANGGGLLQALASFFTGSGGASAAASVATAATGRIPGYAVGRIPEYTVDRLPRFSAGGATLSTRANVDGSGLIHGPGSGTSDSILALMNDREPIRISNREAIIRADAVAHYGPSVIKAINERRLDRERVVERDRPITLAGARGYAEGRVPERPRMAPLYMPQQTQAPAVSQGPVKVEVITNGTPQQVESAEMVTDGRGQPTLRMQLGDAFSSGANTPRGRQTLAQYGAKQRPALR